MNAPATKHTSDHSASDTRHRRGLLYGLGAYGLWGVIPIYFKQLEGVASLDIVAHRILWSMPFLILLVTLSAGWAKVRAVLADRRTLALLALTAVLVGTNWLVYVYSVVSGHILASSFGYYLNPLANVLLGRFVLKEKLSRWQWIAVGIAAAGIAVLAAGALSQIWISLTLCVSFALYGLLRKVVKADSLTGLTVETALLFPAAVAWLAWAFFHGSPVLGRTNVELALLVAAGVVSTTPLLFFTEAARRLKYSTLGMLQFLAPTLQFLIAVFLYGEPFTTAHAIAFGAIWTALIIYVTVLVRQQRPTPIPE